MTLRLAASLSGACLLSLFSLALASSFDRSEMAGRPLAAARLADVPCTACHTATPGSLSGSWQFLDARAHLGQTAWADSLHLPERCGTCHDVPDPAQLPAERWPEAIDYMHKVQAYLTTPPGEPVIPEPLDRKTYLDLLHYFMLFSDAYAALPPDPPLSETRFAPSTLGLPVEAETPPRVSNVHVVDLDQDGRQDVLVCDFNRSLVTWITHRGGRWQERPLARVPFPGHTAVADVNQDGHLDVAVAVLGTDVPSDAPRGGVSLLLGTGDLRFRGKTILQHVGRVADVRPGDFDGDGDVDFVVAIFGWLKTGEIGWLEQTTAETFTYHRITGKAGGVHVVPTDLNHDGALDFVALIAQEHEEITAFLNDGRGAFAPQVLFRAPNPTFGLSGMELADLDRDGDLDILFTNGDAVDLRSSMVRPYHGVHWLENRGNLAFAPHRLLHLYGAYRAVAGDVDADGDLDVFATSLVNDWADSARVSLVLLENDGAQHFTARGVARAPTHLITAATGDLDADGRLDLVTGSMHFEPPYDRLGRVTLWRNLPASTAPD